LPKDSFSDIKGKMKKIVDVSTGEVEFGGEKTILRSTAIGSCIVIAACDFKKKAGALAHIMLPGRAPQSDSDRTKYAADAIEHMLQGMNRAGANEGNVEVCLVGAGNVLKEEDDTICEQNIESTTKLLQQRNIPVRASVLGGTERKSVSLDIAGGKVFYTEGDGDEKLLWEFGAVG
jgi:chemotaxis protein CheD